MANETNNTPDQDAGEKVDDAVAATPFAQVIREYRNGTLHDELSTELPNGGEWPAEVRARWALHTCGHKPKEALLGRCTDCAWRMWSSTVEQHAAHIFDAAIKGGFARP